jgi:hypothetical protein
MCAAARASGLHVAQVERNIAQVDCNIAQAVSTPRKYVQGCGDALTVRASALRAAQVENTRPAGVLEVAQVRCRLRKAVYTPRRWVEHLAQAGCTRFCLTARREGSAATRASGLHVPEAAYTGVLPVVTAR